MKDDTVGLALRQLNEWADRLDQPEAKQQLTEALAHESNRVVQRAAEWIGKSEDATFIPPLVKAYWRLKRNPLKRDPGCLAKTAIIQALVQLELDDPAIFRDGIEYQQIEPGYGKETDTAAELRGNSAIGLTHFAPTLEVLNRCAVLLVDPWPAARYGAVQALGVLAVPEAAPLLKLKILQGDPIADIHGECCASLLKIEKHEAFDFIQPFLASPEADQCVQTALALGESQLPGVFEILRTAWGKRSELAARESILLCIGLLRSNESQTFLLSLIHRRDIRTATDAIKALQLNAGMGDLRQRVEAAVNATGNETLRQEFQQEWADV